MTTADHDQIVTRASEPIISADSHLDLGWLPADVFTSRVASKWRERVPQIADTDEGPRWVADGVILSGVGGVGSVGRTYIEGRWKRADAMADTGLYSDGQMRPANPEERWRDQDRDGVEAEVIYGLNTIGLKIRDPELQAVVLSTFNDWLAEFCATMPHRYIGLVCLPSHDAKDAANELRRGMRLGLRGALIDIKNGFRPIYHEDWDPLWNAAEEADIPISFHLGRRFNPVQSVTGVMKPAEGYDRVEAATSLSCVQFMNASEYFSIVFGGVLDRFPKLKIVLGESGIGWIPSLLSRMDYTYENEFKTLGLKLKPSEYWSRQMWATFQTDPVGARLIDILGADRVMFASDHPHPDGIWPDARTFIQEELGHLGPAQRSRVLHDNAAGLYRIGD